MSILSPFQLLPDHIVRLVVSHVVGSSRVVNARVRPNSKEYATLLRPLLWVCCNFRATALLIFCRHYTLDLDVQNLQLGLLETAFCAHDFLGHPTHHLARHLNIKLSSESIFLGKALECLSRVPYDGCAFPLARVLEFYIHPSDIDDLGEGIEANVDAFVQRIKDMAPMLQEIWVGVGDYDSVVDVSRRSLSSLVSRLFQLADRIEFKDAYEAPGLDLVRGNDACHLSHIKCKFYGYDSRIVQLVRQSAHTLQSLVLDFELYVCLSSFIQSDDGSHVTYPFLHTLRLLWYPPHDNKKLPVFGNGVVPFPSLRHIDLPHFYPFGDDTLFRGNTATLERLAMRLGFSTVAMLRKHSIFTPTSHPKLWSARIIYKSGLIPSTFTTVDESVLFSLSVGPGASVRELSGAAHVENPATALAHLGSHTNLRILDLVMVYFELWDAISLIKSLPLLSDLHSSSPLIGQIPAGVAEDELADYVCSTHGPMGRRFRCWHLRGDIPTLYDQTTMCVALLALACPNFSHVALYGYDDRFFKRELEKTIALDMFTEHVPRLRRLL